MLDVPDTFWPELMRASGSSELNRIGRFHVVYELLLDAGTEYYAPLSVTFGGSPYTPLAIRSTGHREEMRKLKASLRVVFSNVTNTLRAKIEPTDLLSGRDLIARLLLRDTSDVLLAESLVLFRGVMERPKRVGELDFEITVVDRINGADVEIPRRRTAPYCPWLFANSDAYDGGGRCRYQSTTTATNSGTDSTALTVADGTNLVDGREIIIGAASNEAVAIASGGGTSSITLAAARTWSSSDPVRYADCNREIDDCTKRDQTEDFGGVPTVLTISRLAYRKSGFREPLPV